MNTQIVIQFNKSARAMLLPSNVDKFTKSRINQYLSWLHGKHMNWANPDLAAYRDYLLQSRSPVTVQAHLSTVRGQYRRIIAENATRDLL